MARPVGLEPAVTAGDDLPSYARLLARIHEATMSGSKAPARPRRLISQSWQRLRAQGLDPEHPGALPTIDAEDLEGLRDGSGLRSVLSTLTSGLVSQAVEDAILIVADYRGRVLWRRGPTAVLTKADRLGFVDGANWAEDSVGTNAIGTALVRRRPVQIFSAEHYVRSHHPWTCAASPIRDPRTRRILGVVNLSGPATTAHPASVALVDVVARLAESQLREQHRRSIDRLRALAAPMLARLTEPAVAVDDAGWVVAVQSIPPQQRLLLPDTLAEGSRTWVPTLGPCAAETLPGGWLLRPLGDNARDRRYAAVAELDLRSRGEPQLRLTGQYGEWAHRLSPRHAEILEALASKPDGYTARELACELFGDGGRAVTVRAEMSRLRRCLGGVIATQPYRFDENVAAQVLLPETGCGSRRTDRPWRSSARHVVERVRPDQSNEKHSAVNED